LAQKKIDPEIGRLQKPTEVGGLYQVVSELIFFCLQIADKRRTVRGYSLIPSSGIRVRFHLQILDKGIERRNSGNIKLNQKQRFICIQQVKEVVC
jgi:hypothetical protein